MAGVNVIYDSGKFSWKYTPPATPQGPAATELRLKWGTNQGVYPNVKTYGVATLGDDVKNVLPAGSLGQYYAIMAVWNGTKEGPVSTEVPFVLNDGAAGGTITFTIS